MKTILATLTAVTLIACAGSAFANDEQRDRRGPPEAAFEACAELAVDASCSVTRPDGGVAQGVCAMPPRLDRVVCVPNDHLKSKGKHRQQRDTDSDTI